MLQQQNSVKITIMPTAIKNMDTKCSRGCVQNWTKHNQKPPIGHYCNCTIAKNKVAI
jgi:hypothetical protein